jgi:hypothetical protein
VWGFFLVRRLAEAVSRSRNAPTGCPSTNSPRTRAWASATSALGNGSSRSSANRSGRRAAVGSPPLDPAVYRRAPRPRRPRQSVDLGRPQGPGRRVRLAGLACARSRALQAHRPGVRNRSCAAGAGRHRPQPRAIWRHPRLPCHSNRTHRSRLDDRPGFTLGVRPPPGDPGLRPAPRIGRLRVGAATTPARRRQPS